MRFLDKAKDLLSQIAPTRSRMAIDTAGEFVDDKTQGKSTPTPSYKVAGGGQEGG